MIQEVIEPDFFNKETQQFEPKIERGLPLSDAAIAKGYLVDGHMLIAANWLEIVYWQSGVTATSLDTILKAYDLMPDVPRPTFV